MRVRLTGCVALTLLGACSGAVDDEQVAAPEPAEEPAASEVHYLGSRDRPIRESYPAGGALVKPTLPFRAVDVRLTGAQGAPDLDFQIIGVDGAVGPWQPLPLYSGESPIQGTAWLDLDAPARSLRLRGAETLDFARLEFFTEPFGEGHSGYDDDDARQAHDDIVTKAAHAGRWSLPPDVARVGDQQRVTRVGASGGCVGGLSAGAAALGQYLVAHFAGARNFGGYACRRIRGGSGLSVHAVGRAIDVFVPLHGGQADNDLGDPIAHWLIEHAEHIGVQLIIWDRSIWSTSRTPRFRAYGGSHPHHDHLHIELTPAAARRQTGWFQGGGEAPAPVGGKAGWGPCRVSGAAGRCLPTGQCEGVSTPGFCPGGRDVQCCTPREAPGAQPQPQPQPGGGTSWASAYRGLSLGGSEIPRRGLANGTLRGVTGERTEPLGDLTTLSGARFVSGRLSHFGGPDDRGVGADETGAISGERLRSLNTPLNASAAELRARPGDFYYVAMRFDYSPNGTRFWRQQRLLVVDPVSGRGVVVRPVDWGPHTRTRRVIDVSPQTERDLGVRTDSTVLVAFADPAAPLGPTGDAARPPADQPPADQPPAEQPPAGQPPACAVGGREGVCISTADCGGVSTPGYCPGAAHIQCCTEPPPRDQVESWGSCEAGGVPGECARTLDCWGTSTRGLCPGPNEVQCCTD